MGLSSTAGVLALGVSSAFWSNPKMGSSISAAPVPSGLLAFALQRRQEVNCMD